MNEAAARQAIDHLLAAGGTDIVQLDGRLYRLTAEQLTPDTVSDAAREILESQSDDHH
ncbi:hypothetical protein FIU88_08080 [Halomonas sp. THAF12]|uniref:hypothetical protein n=1 Tax=Halomonas sp. THAF12 TaxID=2587849 RepID=UPI0012AA8BDE|nr:hypothetical protein [Halomonas sp. THAF12]QFT84931.1 hypothetical protein FIU88_08080 [Halomonas sp. THAF12]